MSTEINLSRWKLYAKVWETPISRLAADLGISDVGLRKACIRHDIPVPPRGHWARRSAGQKVHMPPLPRPGDDDVVLILPGGPRARPRPRVPVPPVEAGAGELIVLPTTLDGCHPLVRKTARFFAEAKADQERKERRRLAPVGRPNWSVHPQLKHINVKPLVNGRLSSLGEGRLHIVATLRNIDWILRFHEALVRALRAHGIRIIPRDGPELDKVQIVGHGGTLTMAFMEEFKKQPLRGSKIPGAYEYVADDSFKLQFQVPATQAPKTIRGDKVQMEAALPTLGARVAQWLAGEAERERFRVIKEEEAKVAAAARKIEMDAWFAERQKEHDRQALLRQRQASRTAQAGRLMEAAKAQAEYLLALEWLGRLEAETGDDEAVRAWVSAARAGLTEPFATLLNAIRQEASEVERPLWWPEPPSGG